MFRRGPCGFLVGFRLGIRAEPGLWRPSLRSSVARSCLVGQAVPPFSHFYEGFSVTGRKRLCHAPALAGKVAILFRSTRHNSARMK
jgi:hypothetical protein